MGQTTYFSKDGQYLGSMEYDPGCGHPNAKRTGETCHQGCCDYYRCPDCGKRFLVECPD